MQNEAETAAMARLERAISALEEAVDRTRDSPASDSGDAEDLVQRHDALKREVSQCLAEIDDLLREQSDA